ncbi:hypothetical protein [Gaetbulibacter aestuarii]|uniref:Transmembrane protein n=1 Tax=Gaetbulibacter aestuarii TaxID=1502358 RepID=A0ABW7MXL3_9FLAO
MKANFKWERIVFKIGVMALIIGALDPLEGSIIIMIGSALIALSLHLRKDDYRKFFLFAFLTITFGVFFLFYLSSLGGFGGTSTLSWWWALLIVPYPMGWITSIILLIIRTIRNAKNKNT